MCQVISFRKKSYAYMFSTKTVKFGVDAQLIFVGFKMNYWARKIFFFTRRVLTLS